MNHFENKFCGITKVEVKNIEYTWKICKFSSICKETGEYISSTTFTHSKDSSVIWRLDLYPNGDSKDTKDFVSLFLHNVRGCHQNYKFHVRWNFSIVDSKQEERFTITSDFIFSDQIGFGIPKFLRKDYIQNKGNGILVNDTLIIVCRMTIGGDGQSLTCQADVVEAFQSPVVHNSHFSDNLRILLNNKELTDLTLIAHDQEFQIHKAILAAQSPVFMAMFKSDMKEKNQNRVEVTDFNSDVIKAMLHYVYTGQVNNINDFSPDLLEIADKYAIDGLKSISENMLHKKLNINNAVETLFSADRCNCQRLKTKVIKFIIAHKDAVIRLPAFETLKKYNPHLVVDIFCDTNTSN